jgi:glyoxylase-like metal-dependent hydrolase (beta-lactamase superfamily II)
MSTASASMFIKELFDPATFTLTYVVHDPKTRDAVVIDPVLDYDPLASRTDTHSVRQVEAYLRSNELKLHLVLETHAHADHLSGSQYLKKRFGANVVIGEQNTAVQKVFRGVFALAEDFAVDGSQFDRLVKDGEVIEAGSLRIRVLATPGHTPACVSYLIEDAVFTGDALFIEDYGTGRCDFPSGSADALYSSIQKLYALPEATRVFVGHDYQPNGRPLRFETTIAASKQGNVQITAATTREAFVQLRDGRDKTLAAPRLLYPSVQINVDAGRLPAPGAFGLRRLRVPLNMGLETDDDGTPR